MAIQKIGVRFCVFFVFSTLLVGCKPNEATTSAVDEVIGAFQNSCSTHGPWTDIALRRSQQLVGIYQSLIEKANCKNDPNVARALSSAQDLQRSMLYIKADQALSQEKTNEQLSQDLLLLLSDPAINSDATVKQQLLTYYLTAKYEQAVGKSKSSYVNNPDYAARMNNGLNGVANQLQNLLDSSGALAKCYADNPGLGMEIGASIGELAGAFVTPMVGMGISGISKLIQITLRAAQMAPSIDAIYNVRANMMPTALVCGMEAMTTDYCKAKDAETLLLLTRENDKKEVLPFFTGIDLQDRYLPIAYSWLDHVVNGTGESRDLDQAHRKVFQFDRLSTSDNQKRLAEGFVNEYSPKVKGALSSKEAVNYLKIMVSGLTEIYFQFNQGGGFPHAQDTSLFGGYLTARQFVDLLVGETKKPSDTVSYGSLSDYVNASGLSHEDLGLVLSNLKKAVDDRYKTVFREFNEKVGGEASITLREASKPNVDSSVSPLRISALDVFQRVLYFFDRFSFDPKFHNDEKDAYLIGIQRQKLQDTIALLSDPANIHDEGPSATPGGPPTEPAKDAVRKVYDMFKLSSGNISLPLVLSELISTDVTNRYVKGEGPKSLEELYKYAAVDLSTVLSRSNVHPGDVLKDIANSKKISIENMKQMRAFFAKALDRAMKDTLKAARDNKEGYFGDPTAENRYVLSQLCVLTLITGMDWPGDIDRDTCRGATLVTPSGFKLKFEEIEAKFKERRTSLGDRMCTYFNFYRKDQLYNSDLGQISDHGSDRFRFLQRSENKKSEDREFWQKVVNHF